MPSDSGNFVKRWLLGWAPFWAWSGLVYESAILPPRRIPSFLEHFNDKLIHGTLYFVLAAAGWIACRHAKTVFLNRHRFAAPWVYCAVMGVATELSQLYVPGRSCDFFDWVADVSGALAALLLVRWAERGK